MLYRFALGEEVTATTGVRARLSRPLDWLVISDHAEMYGLMPKLLSGDPQILATTEGKRWYDALKSGDKESMFCHGDGDRLPRSASPIRPSSPTSLFAMPGESTPTWPTATTIRGASRP